jgi:hypothetical protein
MPAYDFSLNPPAPIADVVVAHPTSGVSNGIRGKLDCGADITVIPEDLATQLGITPRGHMWIKGYDGNYSLRPIYYIRLVIEGFDLASVRCVATTLILHIQKPNPDFPIVSKINWVAVLALQCKIGVLTALMY